MQLTSDQVLALAPDSGSAANGKKLANPRHWKSLGQSEEMLWGECQGSALYQVQVELASMTVKCSCPSHKFPCKHGLGLLLLSVDAQNVPAAEPPEWVRAWLAKRAAAAEQRATKSEQKDAKTSPEEAAKTAAKRADKRLTLVQRGVASLDLWMSDLMRNGLASVESQPATFWERQAAAMVDAQAPGIAGRLRHMAGIPGASREWPEKLLSELGRLALLTHSFARIEALDAALQEDVRQLVGWALKEEEVGERGERVLDDWLVLGQHVVDEDRGRTQRTWLLGAESRRPALILQFSFMGQPFKEQLLPGTAQRAELVFWPGAAPVRARFDTRHGELRPLTAMPGADTIQAALRAVADALARQPWHDRFLCVLRAVTPVCAEGGTIWHVVDREGAALPLVEDDHWRLLALSGGAAVDLAGEWNGETLRPLGMIAEGTYHTLGGAA
jgi:hypothetical protein